jgi:hypothetical protein
VVSVYGYNGVRVHRYNIGRQSGNEWPGQKKQEAESAYQDIDI